MSRGLVSGVIGSGMLLVGLIFDARLPLDVAAGTTHVAAVAVGLLAGSRRLLVALATVAVLFIAVGMFLSPGDITRVALLNRALAVLATIAVAALGDELITSRQRFGRRMLEMARTDELTGTHTRRALLSELDQRVREHDRYGTELSIVMFDVDRFKQLNDRYGHLTGDRVLRVLGTTCRAVARESDVVGRYGGDEFLVVCPNTPGANAAALGARMRRAVAATRFPELRVGERVTISLGVASLGPRAATTTALIAEADRALYAAKRDRGRTGVGRRGRNGAGAVGAARHGRRGPRRPAGAPQ